MKTILISTITFYQRYLSFDGGVLSFLAPGGACKFPLRCSEYTKQQIQSEGIFKGLWLGAKRIASCR